MYSRGVICKFGSVVLDRMKTVLLPLVFSYSVSYLMLSRSCWRPKMKTCACCRFERQPVAYHTGLYASQ